MAPLDMPFSGPSSTTETSKFSGLYNVNNYRSIYNNYITRGGIIPYSNKVEYIKFLTRFYLSHGYLRGLLEKIGALMAQPIQIRTDDTMLQKRCESFLDGLNYRSKQSEVIVTQMLYDYAVLVYFPKQDLFVKCPECGKVTQIDRNYMYPFRILPLPSGATEYSTVRSDYEIPWAERRRYDQPLGLRVTCMFCGTEFLQEPTTQWDFKTPGSLRVMNPLLVNVYVNDAGKKYVLFDSRYYEGALLVNTDLEYFNIEGLPWDIIKLFASRSKVYMPSPDFCVVFSYNDMSGIGSGGGSVSPVLSVINEMISIDIIRMGNEGIAFSKMDPLYIISPTDVSGQGALEIVDRRKVRDFIVEGIKSHDEGDIQRAMFSPIPVTAQALYGDGSRFIGFNELVSFQAQIPASFGFSPDVFQGGSGVLFNDPFNITMINNLFDRFRITFLTLIDNILSRGVDGYRSAKSRDSVQLELDGISIMKGGLKFEEWFRLLQEGIIDVEEVLKYLGRPGLSYWLKRRNDLEIKKIRADIDLEHEKSKILADLSSKTGEDIQATGKPNRALAEHQIIEEAEQHVQYMTQFANDAGKIRSYLESLEAKSPVLAAVVSKQWRVYINRLRQENDAKDTLGG